MAELFAYRYSYVRAQQYVWPEVLRKTMNLVGVAFFMQESLLGVMGLVNSGWQVKAQTMEYMATVIGGGGSWGTSAT
jgi:hypothetical protein